MNAAYEAATRVLGVSHASQLTFLLDTSMMKDYFRISGDDGDIRIYGTSPSVCLTGLNWYLKYTVKCNISWNGEQLDISEVLPAPDDVIEKKSNVMHRFALNDTDDGYTQPYADWEYWEDKIDILAFHGINEVLVYPGQEAVYYETFKEFGYTDEELLRWIPRPAHQPWWLMQNMSNYPSPMLESLLRKRAALGKRISSRLKELGMTPVFPGYYGSVPVGFGEKHSRSRVVPQGSWVGFEQPSWLDPTCDIFVDIAASFYKNQEDLFGETDMFKMDLLHEGGNAGEVPIREASSAVQKAMEKAHPGAIWVILGWQDKPDREVMAGAKKERMLILDGLADRYNTLNRETEWQKTPYAFGTIWNFGGHTTMGANISTWNEKYWQQLNERDSSLEGIAIMPEGSDNNPVAFDFMAEIPWRNGPVSLDEWFDEWAVRRYGRNDYYAKEAWRALQRTAYNMYPDGWSEAQDSLFTAEPSLRVTKAATWSPEAMRYDSDEFAKALPNLLSVDEHAKDSSAYRYDLMDITRQVIANESRVLHPRIIDAFEQRSKKALEGLVSEWLQLMALLDEVVGTNSQTMLGRWLMRAREYITDKDESIKSEHDARLLVTCWGHKTASRSGLNDYGNREWQGLVGDYYYHRWKTFFHALMESLEADQPVKEIDWYSFTDEWSRQTNDFPTEPIADIRAVANRVQQFFFDKSRL